MRTGPTGGPSLGVGIWSALREWPLDREFLTGLDIPPAEIARVSERAHFLGSRRKFAYAGAEAPVEEFGERAIPDRLELSHVDVKLADKRLDFARAPARVLINSVEPIIERLGFDPLCNGTLGLAFVVLWSSIHSSTSFPRWRSQTGNGRGCRPARRRAGGL
jgi:hypothetical protein